MKLRFRLAAAASALALAGGLALVFAGPAAADVNDELCAFTVAGQGSEYCVYVYDNGIVARVIPAPGVEFPPNSEDFFSFPTTNGAEGEIYVGPPGSGEGCLTVEGSSYVVEREECDGTKNPADEWTNRSEGGNHFALENVYKPLYLNIDIYNDTVNAYGAGEDYWVKPS